MKGPTEILAINGLRLCSQSAGNPNINSRVRRKINTSQHRKRVVYQYDELLSSRGLLYGEIGLAITYLEVQSGNLSMVI